MILQLLHSGWTAEKAVI